jgi:HD-GYP domain-containing protein (c-di-GMP phosphodiesterase class II)
MDQSNQQQLSERLQRLINIGIALSAEKDPDVLLEQILMGAKEITNADGGTLYTVEDGESLKFAIIHTASLNFHMGGTSGESIPFEPIPLSLPDGTPNDKLVVANAVINACTINIPDAYTAEGFDFSGTRSFDEKTGYRSQSFLTIPLKNHEDDIIGVLQLINAQDETSGGIIPFSDEDQQLTEALASQAAIAMTNRSLLDEMRALFESFIQLLATAIDDKSPYTGGHCRRVPEITMLLAEATHSVESGPLKDFRLSEKDRYELQIACWLHDCGKVTTPEYVVDKATKLETIYDRINTVGTRFGTLKLQLENDFLQRRIDALESGTTFDTDTEAAKLAAQYQVLDDELAFIQKANIGGEFMRDEDKERVAKISTRTYRSTSDGEQPLLTENEVYNLCIARGTLTAEERDVINHHIVATIKMLESLPFPKHLRRVAEFAGGHHERMDGKGYPRGLKRDEMSLQARMLGIADVFEALTAKDRPYKVGKTLTESLTIMGKMRLDNHIDPDLFDVFIEQGVYKEYAEKFMSPEQIDEVDLGSIPGYQQA